MRAILVPVKSFEEAKHRLEGTLTDRQREHLARDLAERVLGARGPCPAFVACDDNAVADWAAAAGATVLWTPGLGLSGAVGAGVHYLGGQGFELVVVAHADLPFAHDLNSFGADGVVTIAPDRRLDGTNVIAVPATIDFSFSYGPRSYDRHRAEALRLGLRCTSIFDWRLAVDIDLPGDLPIVRDLVAENPRGEPASHGGTRTGRT